MFKINGGATAFDQWSVGHALTNEHMSVGDRVSFRTACGGLRVMYAYDNGGTVMVNVPNQLLQGDKPIIVDLAGHPGCKTIFPVNPKAKPADYDCPNADRHDPNEVKGGSGGVSSWNDLTDKPFGEEKVVIEWDGDVGDRVSVDGSATGMPLTFVKVSEKTIAAERLTGTIVKLAVPQQAEQAFTIAKDMYNIFDGAVLCLVAGQFPLAVVYDAGAFVMGVTFPEPGIYFPHVGESGMKVYASYFENPGLVRIESKFIATEIVRRVTIDTEKLETYEDWKNLEATLEGYSAEGLAVDVEVVTLHPNAGYPIKYKLSDALGNYGNHVAGVEVCDLPVSAGGRGGKIELQFSETDGTKIKTTHKHPDRLILCGYYESDKQYSIRVEQDGTLSVNELTQKEAI